MNGGAFLVVAVLILCGQMTNMRIRWWVDEEEPYKEPRHPKPEKYKTIPADWGCIMESTRIAPAKEQEA